MAELKYEALYGQEAMVFMLRTLDPMVNLMVFVKTLIISLGPPRKACAITHVLMNNEAKHAVTLLWTMLFLRPSTASPPWCLAGDEVFRSVYLRRACCGV